MVEVRGGGFVMGERSELANGGDGEEPIEVEVEPFRIDAAVGAEWELAARASTVHSQSLPTMFRPRPLLPWSGPDGAPRAQGWLVSLPRFLLQSVWSRRGHRLAARRVRRQRGLWLCIQHRGVRCRVGR